MGVVSVSEGGNEGGVPGIQAKISESTDVPVRVLPGEDSLLSRPGGEWPSHCESGLEPIDWREAGSSGDA